MSPQYTWFGDPNSAIDNVVITLMSYTSVSGGNPFMEYVFALDKASNVTTLMNDLTVAHDYNTYQSDPMAFNLALAESGSSISLQAWQTEYARAQALGLTNFTSANGSTLTIQSSIASLASYQSSMPSLIAGDSFNFALTDTSANIIADMPALQALLAAGQLVSITLSDASTPALTLTAAQYTADQAVLNTITTAYTLLVTGVTAANAATLAANANVTKMSVADTAANIDAQLTSLQTLASASRLSSLNVTDGSVNNLALTATQLTADVAALNDLTGTFGETVSVSSANASGAITGTVGGKNTISFAGSTTGITANLTQGGTATMGSNTYTLSNFQNIISSTHADTITLASGDSAWIAGSGGSTVNAANGDTVNISGNGQTGTADAITMSSGSAVLQTGAHATFSGSSNTITVAQNDTVAVVSGADTLIAGTGGDVFTNSGGSGNIYEFASGFGQDTINNSGTGSAVANGSVAFLGSITDENLWFQKSGNNLLVDQLGTSNQITLTNWYGSANAEISSFVASGLTLDSQIQNLVQAMATYSAANTGFNPVTATTMPTNTALQTEIAAAWHH